MMNNMLPPRLVAVDSYYLSHIDEYLQQLETSCLDQITALETVSASDSTSTDVIASVRAALFYSSQQASDVSDMIGKLSILPQIEVSDNEPQ